MVYTYIQHSWMHEVYCIVVSIVPCTVYYVWLPICLMQVYLVREVLKVTLDPPVRLVSLGNLALRE